MSNLEPLTALWPAVSNPFFPFQSQSAKVLNSESRAWLLVALQGQEPPPNPEWSPSETAPAEETQGNNGVRAPEPRMCVWVCAGVCDHRSTDISTTFWRICCRGSRVWFLESRFKFSPGLLLGRRPHAHGPCIVSAFWSEGDQEVIQANTAIVWTVAPRIDRSTFVDTVFIQPELPLPPANLCFVAAKNKQQYTYIPSHLNRSAGAIAP